MNKQTTHHSKDNLFVYFKYLNRLSNTNGFSTSSLRDGGHAIIKMLHLLIIDLRSFAYLGHQKRKCYILSTFPQLQREDSFRPCL